MTEQRELTRDVEATLIPHGDPYPLKAGETVTITHRLGGNFTVTTGFGMYRIAAADADALGEDASEQPDEKTFDENAAAPTEEEIRVVLQDVFDPEIPVNVVDLGLIYEVRVTSEESGGYLVETDLTLTAPGCGMGPVIAEDCRQRILKMPAVAEARVELVWDPPWTQEMISEKGKMEMGLI
ncbi:MAG: putative Fe-S cluster assembly protein SufT [Opitutales bacterium]